MESKINWFPGHMAKALAQMEDEIKKVDMLIYVLDARAPFSCLNPKFTSMALQKPVLYVLNKTDLSDDEKTSRFKKYIESQQDCKCVCLNSTVSGANKIVEPIMKQLCIKKMEKYQNKGIKINLRAMVVGVPNSGKSTLINNLCGLKKAKTGDKAGVTKGKQWVLLKNGFEVLDTPGTLWPNLDNQTIAQNLAIIGSIKNEIVDTNELCFYFLNYVKENYSTCLQKYDIVDTNYSAVELMEQIAQKKHYLQKGNEPDFDRTCFAIIDDFRKGKLGKITLDKVNVWHYANKRYAFIWKWIFEQKL